MNKTIKIIIALLLIALLFIAIYYFINFSEKEEAMIAEEEIETEIANPASLFCINQRGELEIRTAEDGSQTGYCLFEDGSECEEWSFFRGSCAVGETL